LPADRPTTIEDALREAVAHAAGGEVSLGHDLAGFPGTAHGGAVAALFHRLALPRWPARLAVRLIRGVPTGTPLTLTTGSHGAEARLTVAQGDRVLAEATVSREGLPDPADADGVRSLPREPGDELPGTRTCLACGSANPVGVGVRLRVSPRLVWREFEPPRPYRARPAQAALVTIVLDELGWWLGALDQTECGVTTEVMVTFWRPLPTGPIIAIGDRAAVTRAGDERGRFSGARGYLLGADGEPVAAVQVVFAGSRAYTRRLLGPFLQTTGVERLRALFPSVRPPGTDCFAAGR
jgi:acyl-coenzyme A thioesterase PaaI-like protein